MNKSWLCISEKRKKEKKMNLDSSDTNSKFIDGTFNPLTCSYGMYVKKWRVFKFNWFSCSESSFILSNSADPDEMPHFAASYLGLHYL